tara:strand:+ start:1238 stop:2143 length:906 start_codon:yes stop_codon:yes gene_type:complete
MKFNKKISFELDLNPLKGFEKKVTATFNSSNEKDLIVNYAVLSDLADIQLEEEDALASIRASTKDAIVRRDLMRYGAVLSIDEYVHWTLNLLARVKTLKSNSRYTASNLLEEYVTFLRNKAISQDTLQYNSNTFSRNEMNVYNHALMLKKVIYCKDERSKEPEVVEGFIPEMSYHPIPLFRTMLLCLLDPKLIDFSDAKLLAKFFHLDELEDPITGEALKEEIMGTTSKEMLRLIALQDIDIYKPSKENKISAAIRFEERRWRTNFYMIHKLGQAKVDRFFKRLELNKKICNSIGDVDLKK